MMDKRYEHGELEKEIQKFWEDKAPYLFDEKSKKNVYSIDTPPPTVSGALHIGHVFSYTQTDLIARYKRMQGFNVFYPMGFDDNGLPTERFVEKKHKVRGHKMKRSEFIKLCLEESKEMAQASSQLWKALGLSVDWTTLYSTISDRARKISQNSFIELYKKGLIFKKEEPALYCTTCRTTVAQAELDSKETSATFNKIIFKSENKKELIVSTTRPELLPACVALFFHPSDERYKNLLGKKAITPVFEKEIPILADELVDKEKGTGLVMCCTFGDQTDVTWYKKHNLPFVQVVGRDGLWTEKAGSLAELKVIEARKKMLELLKEAGALKDQEKITHSTGVHERCGQEIEYLVLNQWFVKILDHKNDFIKLSDEINWKPDFMKARYKDWVQNLKWDWCISRQRFYGVQFPVWYCGDCKEILLAEKKDLPVDPQEQDFPGGVCTKCSGKNIVPETDIMDTWNTSSLTPQINITDRNLSLPMSMRAQAHDIIRTWTFYTIVKSFYHEKTIPWKDIAVSGFVVSKGKEKISKSKGNSPSDPENLLKNYPADAIRYWAANGRLGVDSVFNEKQFKIGQRLLTKLWNAFRFCKDHIEAYEKKDSIKLDALNEWVIFHLSETIKNYKKHFDEYEYAFALECAEKFFWQIFCDNYLELIKDRIFNPDEYNSDEIAATQHTLYEVGFGILQIFAPFTPHIAEKLYQLFFSQKEKDISLHTTILDEKRFFCDAKKSVVIIDEVVKIVGLVRKFKSEQKLSLKSEIEELVINCDSSMVEYLKTQEKIIAGATKAKKIVYSGAPRTETSVDVK
jgi:valyl-tRNA synthetase